MSDVANTAIGTAEALTGIPAVASPAGKAATGAVTSAVSSVASGVLGGWSITKIIVFSLLLVAGLGLVVLGLARLTGAHGVAIPIPAPIPA